MKTNLDLLPGPVPDEIDHRLTDLGRTNPCESLYGDNWEQEAAADLRKQGPRKFSRSTPKRQTEGYLKLLPPDTGVAPTVERLVEDFGKCFGDNLQRIYAAKGIIVPGLGNRHGDRAHAAVDHAVERRGGHRPKGPAKQPKVLHPYAEAARAERMKQQKTLYESKRS